MAISHLTHVSQADLAPLGFAFDYEIAFQPIFDVQAKSVWAYEALVRGPNRQSAEDVLAQIPPAAIYAADQHYRETAIRLASDLGMQTRLSLNCLRGALLGPQDYIAATMACADRCGFPTDQLVLEFSEKEPVLKPLESRRAVNRHHSRGFQTAMDDFGAGFQGLSLLCEVRPDIIKLDMSLIRDIDVDPRRAKIVTSIINLCQSLGVTPICEGIETTGELAFLQDIGVALIQGYLLARPKISGLLSADQVAAALNIESPALRPSA